MPDTPAEHECQLCSDYTAPLSLACLPIGGAAYLFYLSRKLATACAAVTALLWIVALCYGNFSRKAQRTYQDALAETNQVDQQVNFIVSTPDSLGVAPDVSHQNSWLASTDR